MNVKVVDNKPIFAKKIIIIGERQIPIFNEQEENYELKKIIKKNETCVIEDVFWDQSLLDKVKDKDFSCRTELIEFLQNDIEPEGESINNLKKENVQLKKQLLEQQDIIDYFLRPQDYKL